MPTWRPSPSGCLYNERRKRACWMKKGDADETVMEKLDKANNFCPPWMDAAGKSFVRRARWTHPPSSGYRPVWTYMAWLDISFLLTDAEWYGAQNGNKGHPHWKWAHFIAVAPYPEGEGGCIPLLRRNVQLGWHHRHPAALGKNRTDLIAVRFCLLSPPKRTLLSSKEKARKEINLSCLATTLHNIPDRAFPRVPCRLYRTKRNARCRRTRTDNKSMFRSLFSLPCLLVWAAKQRPLQGNCSQCGQRERHQSITCPQPQSWLGIPFNHFSEDRYAAHTNTYATAIGNNLYPVTKKTRGTCGSFFNYSAVWKLHTPTFPSLPTYTAPRQAHTMSQKGGERDESDRNTRSVGVARTTYV